ncbi:MAG: GMC family oxidoreductase [Pseudomonadota bacterium]
MADLRADIVVIGAGPTGAIAAYRLAKAGRDVLIVERGDWTDYPALRRNDADWERRKQGPLNANPNIRAGPADDPIDDADTPIKPMIGNAVGGGSVWWSAHVPRSRPEDFRTRTLDGVGEDWPVGYDDLASYYAEVEALWGVASVAGDPSSAAGDPSAVPDRNGPFQPMPSIGAHGRRIAAALDRLGWHWWPVDRVVGHGEGPRCTHPGPCELGCPSRIRSSADRLVARAQDFGARLSTGTRVLRLETDSTDRVVAALCRCGDETFRIEAETFVLAANGIGTPRLLLLSANPRFPDGLANRSGLVGRGLMLHPYGRIDGLFNEPLGAWALHEIAGIVSLEFLPTHPASGAVRGVKLQLAAGPGAASLARGAGHGTPIGWGKRHHGEMDARFDRICGFTVCAEDLPDNENRVELSDRLFDRDGLPAARMVYRVSDNSRALLDHGLDRAGEALKEEGAIHLHRTPLRDQAGFHLMGTTRMGTDPERSVTDPSGRCHDVPNLVIVDASTFVTASCLNPTATAQALALRTADAVLAGAKTPQL